MTALIYSHRRNEPAVTGPQIVSLERPSSRIARVTYANPPVNLIVGPTLTQLADVVGELEKTPEVQVVIFDSGTPDFFYNHFDLAAFEDFPAAPADGVPVWTDLAVRLTQAPFITIGAIRGFTRGGGNELAMALDLRYASREKAVFGQPEVGIGALPGGGGTERLPRAIGRDRALEVILSSADYDAETAERWGWVTRTLPDADLDAHVNATAERLASFDPISLATAKAMVNRATLPPQADLVTAYGQFTESLTRPGYQRRAATRPGDLPAGIAAAYRLGAVIGKAHLLAAARESAVRPPRYRPNRLNRLRDRDGSRSG